MTKIVEAHTGWGQGESSTEGTAASLSITKFHSTFLTHILKSKK